MNETNIKHGYSLMVREARGAILNPGAQISEAGAEFMPPVAQYANIEVRGSILPYTGAPQGLDFITMLAPGAGHAK